MKKNSEIKEFSANKNIKWKPLEFTDKILMFKGSEVKVAARDEQGKFDLNALLHFQYSTSPKLLLEREDFL